MTPSERAVLAFVTALSTFAVGVFAVGLPDWAIYLVGLGWMWTLAECRAWVETLRK